MDLNCYINKRYGDSVTSHPWYGQTDEQDDYSYL